MKILLWILLSVLVILLVSVHEAEARIGTLEFRTIRQGSRYGSRTNKPTAHRRLMGSKGDSTKSSKETEEEGETRASSSSSKSKGNKSSRTGRSINGVKTSKSKTSKSNTSKSKTSKSKSARSSTLAPTVSGTPGATVDRTIGPTTQEPFTQAPTPVATKPNNTPEPTTIAPSSTTTTAPTSVATKPNNTPEPTTIAPSSTTTTAKPDVTSPPSLTPAPSSISCTDNPQDYTVRIDLQIQFEDDEIVACDSTEQDNAINANIQAALNENFATTVSDWNGEVVFGTFNFDPEQEVNNVAPSARRLLPIRERSLQEGTCPPRDVECEADYCRWGCLVASTTDCGTSALTNWFQLADDVRERLLGLNFPCLGTDELEVVLLVEDPEARAARNTPGEDIDESNKFESPNEILLATEETGEETDDGPSRTIELSSELDLHFFDGLSGPPPSSDIMGLVREIKAFFTVRMHWDSKFAEDFVQYDVSSVSHKYRKAETDAGNDTFELDFVSKIKLKQSSRQGPKEIAEALSSYDLKEFIKGYVWKAPPRGINQFRLTEWVKITIKGHK